MNLRVVISCVSFETVKVIDPILYYKADKAYLIYSSESKPYVDFLDEVCIVLDNEGIPFEKMKFYYNDFNICLKNVREIIRREKKDGNHVYVNIGAGPQIFSSAAMIASMMEEAIPFNATVEEYMVQEPEKVFFEKGKPVGNAKKVHDPTEIPLFKVLPPDQKYVQALKIWKEITDKIKIRPTKDVMIELNSKGLLDEIWEDDNQRKCSQSALMRYRRGYIEKFEEKGWIEKRDRGKYFITEQGQKTLDIFC